MSRPLKLVLVAGARPNFMKVAPLIHAIHRHNSLLRIRWGEGGRRPDEVAAGQGEVSSSSASNLPLPTTALETRNSKLETPANPLPSALPPQSAIRNPQSAGFSPLRLDRGLESIGNRRKEFTAGEGAVGAERAGASESLGQDEVSSSSILNPQSPLDTSPQSAIGNRQSAGFSPLRLDRGEGQGEVSINLQSAIDYSLVHTGQHYDAAMSDIFFQELGIPAPNVNLGIGSGSHAVQTANVMIGFEKVCLDQKPDWVLVFGDVNSTVGCTLVAVKMGIRVAHVEAGLRSFDRTMPEEINRIVTDSIADLLLTPSEDANENLRREGVAESRMMLVGNIMIDSLVANLDKARQSTALERFSVKPGSFVYVTLHRPANVDDRANLSAIADELKKLSLTLPVVFPVHPRTRKMLAEFGIDLTSEPGFRLVDPVGYHDSVCLTRNARLVLTDSGGLQEEATYFQTPCLTLRPNTERPVTITLGSNKLTSPPQLANDLQHVLAGERRVGSVPPLWDGETAKRIIATLCKHS